jgi:hypothetical protein
VVCKDIALLTMQGQQVRVRKAHERQELAPCQ